MARRRRLTDDAIFESEAAVSTTDAGYGSAPSALVGSSSFESAAQAAVADASSAASQRCEVRATSKFVKPAAASTADAAYRAPVASQSRQPGPSTFEKPAGLTTAHARAGMQPDGAADANNPQPTSVASLALQLERRLSEQRRQEGVAVRKSVPQAASVTVASDSDASDGVPSEPQGLVPLTSLHATDERPVANLPVTAAHPTKRQLEEVSQDAAEETEMPARKRSRIGDGLHSSVAAIGKAIDGADRALQATFGCGFRRRAPAANMSH